MGARRRVLACLLIAIGVMSCGALAACGARSNQAPLRATLPLPLHEAASVHGSYTTRRLLVPKGYGSTGRAFYVHARRLGGKPEPLVLLLHGLDQSPARVERATAATSFSEAHHVARVYLIGLNEAWNAGGCCRGDSANDVGYLVDLVHYVATLTPVDLHRVYIWGFSNGGMMAWRAVCQTRNTFAGAGVMAGALLVSCPSPVHVVDLHGLRDTTVPYAGGYSPLIHTLIPDSANERSRLAPGSTLQVVLLKSLGHEWPPLTIGRFDALNVLWQGLRGYRVAHPAAVTAPVEG
jgi:poly(3-hydroxybutyrate) depolymerase